MTSPFEDDPIKLRVQTVRGSLRSVNLQTGLHAYYEVSHIEKVRPATSESQTDQYKRQITGAITGTVVEVPDDFQLSVCRRLFFSMLHKFLISCHCIACRGLRQVANKILI